MSRNEHSSLRRSSRVIAASAGSSRSIQSRSPSRYDRKSHGGVKGDFSDDIRSERRVRQGHFDDGEEYYGSETHGCYTYGKNKGGEYRRAQSGPDLSSRRTIGPAASPWDSVSSSPVPIRASGSSVRFSSSCHSRRSHKLTFSAEKIQREYEDREADKSSLTKVYSQEITEKIHLEMEYNSDSAWYRREESNTMFDGDNSSFFPGDDASFQKKEAELSTRLVQKDEIQMSLSQSKKLSKLTADNAQWEDGQLSRYGAVRGTDVQTEYEDEEEQESVVLVHDYADVYDEEPGGDVAPEFFPESDSVPAYDEWYE